MEGHGNRPDIGVESADAAPNIQYPASNHYRYVFYALHLLPAFALYTYTIKNGPEKSITILIFDALHDNS